MTHPAAYPLSVLEGDEMKITDEMVEAGLNACPLNYFQQRISRGEGVGYTRCSVTSDDVRLILEAALAAAPASAATERERAKRVFLAGWMRYDTSADCDISRANAEFEAWWPDMAMNEAHERGRAEIQSELRALIGAPSQDNIKEE